MVAFPEDFVDEHSRVCWVIALTPLVHFLQHSAQPFQVVIGGALKGEDHFGIRGLANYTGCQSVNFVGQRSGRGSRRARGGIWLAWEFCFYTSRRRRSLRRYRHGCDRSLLAAGRRRSRSGRQGGLDWLHRCRHGLLRSVRQGRFLGCWQIRLCLTCRRRRFGLVYGCLGLLALTLLLRGPLCLRPFRPRLRPSFFHLRFLTDVGTPLRRLVGSRTLDGTGNCIQQGTIPWTGVLRR